jgi:hypothetical protein
MFEVKMARRALNNDFNTFNKQYKDMAHILLNKRSTENRVKHGKGNNQDKFCQQFDQKQHDFPSSFCKAENVKSA